MVISNSSNDEIHSLIYKRRGNKNPLLFCIKFARRKRYSYGLFLHTDDKTFIWSFSNRTNFPLIPSPHD